MTAAFPLRAASSAYGQVPGASSAPASLVGSPAVLILLPPSEGKTPPPDGPPVDLGALAYAEELTAKRERVLAALVRTSAGRQRGRALKALGLSAGQAGELQRNAALGRAPAGPAAQVYTGVLFERLGLPGLPAGAQERVLIASALWGVVRPADRIPAYRLSISARLPRIAGLAAYWRPALERALPGEGLVVDLRSGGYAAAWTPRHATVVTVRGFTPEGKVVSHFVKAIRGDVARALLEAPAAARTPEEVAETAARAGLEVELRGSSVDVIARG
jgi:cytoplasmic iron level regulating protein YaaA (DUF328/UPF0246 family)